MDCFLDSWALGFHVCFSLPRCFFREETLFKSLLIIEKKIHRLYLWYRCFIFLQAQFVPSLMLTHLSTSENVPSPFLLNIRYSFQVSNGYYQCLYQRFLSLKYLTLHFFFIFLYFVSLLLCLFQAIQIGHLYIIIS